MPTSPQRVWRHFLGASSVSVAREKERRFKGPWGGRIEADLCPV